MVQYATINALTAALYDDIPILVDASYYTQCASDQSLPSDASEAYNGAADTACG